MTRLAVPSAAWPIAGIGSTFTEIKREGVTPLVPTGGRQETCLFPCSRRVAGAGRALGRCEGRGKHPTVAPPLTFDLAVLSILLQLCLRRGQHSRLGDHGLPSDGVRAGGGQTGHAGDGRCRDLLDDVHRLHRGLLGGRGGHRRGHSVGDGLDGRGQLPLHSDENGLAGQRGTCQGRRGRREASTSWLPPPPSQTRQRPPHTEDRPTADAGGGAAPSPRARPSAGQLARL